MIKFKSLNQYSNVFVTSDLHAYHKNITRGTSSWNDPKKTRNFATEVEMTEHLASEINKVVGEDDLLIHCGDWSFGGEANVSKFRNLINCKNIITIQGNHDHLWNKFTPDLFIETLQIGYFQFKGVQFVCSHYPMFNWHGQNKGSLNIHGHTHGGECDMLKQIHQFKSFDVGIDVHYKYFGTYQPFNLLDVASMLEHNLNEEDHH